VLEYLVDVNATVIFVDWPPFGRLLLTGRLSRINLVREVQSRAIRARPWS